MTVYINYEPEQLKELDLKLLSFRREDKEDFLGEEYSELIVIFKPYNDDNKLFENVCSSCHKKSIIKYVVAQKDVQQNTDFSEEVISKHLYYDRIMCYCEACYTLIKFNE